jgi:hypothetical protein
VATAFPIRADTCLFSPLCHTISFFSSFSWCVERCYRCLGSMSPTITGLAGSCQSGGGGSSGGGSSRDDLHLLYSLSSIPVVSRV